MKKTLMTLLAALAVTALQAQNQRMLDALNNPQATAQQVAQQTGRPVVISPIVYGDNTFSAEQKKLFRSMLTRISQLVDSSPKAYVVQDTAQALFTIVPILTQLSVKATESKDSKGNIVKGNEAEFMLQMAVWDNKENVFTYKTPTYKESDSENGDVSNLYKSIMSRLPEQGRVREAIEGGMKLYGLVTQVAVLNPAKKKKGQLLAEVNLGNRDGVTTTQWFDVYAEGNTSEVLGTLHVETIQADKCYCKLRKNAEEIQKAANAGTTLYVVSREESNIWKSSGRLFDVLR